MYRKMLPLLLLTIILIGIAACGQGETPKDKETGVSNKPCNEAMVCHENKCAAPYQDALKKFNPKNDNSAHENNEYLNGLAVTLKSCGESCLKLCDAVN